MPVSPLAFKLSLDDHGLDAGTFGNGVDNSDARLMEMLAAQAAHRGEGLAPEDEISIAREGKLSANEKRVMLQKSLHMAASNGDADRVNRLVQSEAKQFIDVNGADEEGTAPLIYASCFVGAILVMEELNSRLISEQGHEEVVSILLEAGAQVDRQDRNQWTALMWAMTNRHKTIAKILLDYGASPDVKSSSGRTASDFAAPNSEMSEYLHEKGYNIGDVGIGDDFYDSGFSRDRFEQEMEENETNRRMLMESSYVLEVDLSSIGLDERPEVSFGGKRFVSKANHR